MKMEYWNVKDEQKMDFYSIFCFNIVMYKKIFYFIGYLVLSIWVFF